MCISELSQHLLAISEGKPSDVAHLLRQPSKQQSPPGINLQSVSLEHWPFRAIWHRSGGFVGAGHLSGLERTKQLV